MKAGEGRGAGNKQHRVRAGAAGFPRRAGGPDGEAGDALGLCTAGVKTGGRCYS